MRREAWSLIAFAMAGLECPRPLTATPEKVSKYLFPSVSKSQQPSPLSKETESFPYVFMMAGSDM